MGQDYIFFPGEYCFMESTKIYSDVNLEFNNLDRLPPTFSNFENTIILNLGYNTELTKDKWKKEDIINQ